MTGQTLNSAAERQQYLLNEFAARVVMAGDAEAAPGKQTWLDALETLMQEAEDAFAAQVSSLKSELLSMTAGSKAFFDAADAGIEALSEAIQVPGSAEPGDTDSAALNIAQDPELIADFIVESREHLRAIEQNVLAVEQDRSQMDPVHAMFRAFHTIKGIAGFLELQSIRDVSHETETLLDLARNANLALTPGVIDVILESADYLSREITRIEAGAAGASAPVTKLVSRITAVIEGAGAQIENDLTLLSEAMAVADTIATPAEIVAPRRSLQRSLLPKRNPALPGAAESRPPPRLKSIRRNWTSSSTPSAR